MTTPGAPRGILRIGLGATVLPAAVPVALALSDPYPRPQPVALVVSTTAGALAVSALVLQPLLAARATGRRRLRAHQSLGAVTLGLVDVGAAHLSGRGSGRTKTLP